MRTYTVLGLLFSTIALQAANKTTAGEFIAERSDADFPGL